jgi:hypothetical protein
MNKQPQMLTAEQIFKRAGGRRRYNMRRQDAARARRTEVLRLLKLYGSHKRGVRARIARELGVSAATISRDVRDILLVEWALEHPAKAIRLLWP